MHLLISSQRDGGEPLSIRHLIKQVVEDHVIDPSRVFITRMSSGGAMTSVLLAPYPKVFAGLPYRSADNMLEAMARRNGCGRPSDSQLDALVRWASTFTAPWPTISVWHGDSDTTIGNSNARTIVRQWHRIHKVEGPATRVELVDGYPREVWGDANGRVVIEQYHWGHGPRHANQCQGRPGPWGSRRLDAGRRHILDPPHRRFLGFGTVGCSEPGKAENGSLGRLSPMTALLHRPARFDRVPLCVARTCAARRLAT